MNTVYEDGLIVDRQIKAYQEGHPGTSYRAAWTALMRQEEAEEQEAREEFARRVPVYQAEFKKTYAQAAKMVAAHDDNMVQAYAYGDADSPGLVRRQGEVWQAAKQASTAAKNSMSDAVMRILRDERDVAKKIGGDWLDVKARVEINNQNMGSVISVAYPIALRIVRATFPEVTAMADFGTVSEAAMRIVFIGWFK